MEMRRRRIAQEEEDAVDRQDIRESNESIEDMSCTLRVVTKYSAVLLLILYFAIPTLLYVFPQIVEQIVFMNLVVGYAERTTLDRPTDSWGLSDAANFRVPCDGIELGVWHILPASSVHGYRQNNVASEDEITSHLVHAKKVIIYHHGNGMSRATGENGQRPALYRLLSKEGFHVIAFDYRGYGDSTGWPSESGLVNDSIAVYSWVKSRVSPDTKITFWGHSLGSSIATLATKHIFDGCQAADDSMTTCHGPDILILEGPFTNVRKGADDSNISWLFSFIYPRFLLQWVIDAGLVNRHIYLASDKSISSVRCPVLLLHADDDDIIPSRHSEELYQSCEKSSNHDKMRVKLVKFRSNHGYGHMDIYKAPELPSIIKQFLESDQASGFELSVL